MRSVYLLVDILIAIGLLSLAAVSLTRGGHKNLVNKIFAGFSFLTALWILSNNISNDVRLSSTIALYADYVVFASSFGVMLLLMQFILILTNANKLAKYFTETSLW